MRTALTVAGSDPIAGAGAQADIKAMSASGVHCASVITAVTAQNTQKVKTVFPIPADVVSAQLDSVLSDLDIRAAKTGMLYSPEIIDVVAETLEDEDFPFVVDPVMIATVGGSLYIGEDYVRAVKRRLIPACSLVTPNKAEAEALAGFRIRDEEDAYEACEIIGKNGAAVLLKGGHMDGRNVTDYLYISSGITKIVNPRLRGEAGHGSGCTLSAFITANLANGLDLVTSVHEARKMIQKAIETQYSIGKGVPVVNTQVTLTRKQDDDMVNVLRDLDNAIARIPKLVPPDLIPREGMNIAYAARSPKGPEDIAGVDRRIFVRNGAVSRGGSAKFGAAEHLSFVLMEIMKTHPEIRSVAFFGTDSLLANDMRDAGLKVRMCKGRANEGTVAEAVVDAAVASKPFPDAVFIGGKTETVYVFGKGPREVVSKLEKSL